MLFLAIGLIVGACSGRVRPFAKGAKATSPRSLKKTPVVQITTIRGLSDADSQSLRRQIIHEAGKRGIPAGKSRASQAALFVNGTLRTAPYNKDTAIAYVWDFSDKRSKPLHRITGEDISHKPSTNSKTPDLSAKSIQRIAAHAAAGMAAYLGRQGYSVREISLPPPGDVRNIASVRAEVRSAAAGRAISRNLYKAPAAPGVRTASLTTPLLAQPRRPQPKLALPAPRLLVAPTATGSIPPRTSSPLPPLASPPPPPAPPVRQVITLVVQPVSGANPQINAELTEAIKRALRLKGIRIINAPTATSLKLAGTIEMGAIRRRRQRVNISWHLMNAKGQKMGIVQQANKVRTKSLSRSWGSTATIAARAAARSITNLIPKQSVAVAKAKHPLSGDE